MTPEPHAKVMLVDDHPLVRQGLADLLADEGFDIVATAASESEAHDSLARVTTDLVIVDLTLEHGTGFDILALVNRLQPAALAIVYSVHEDGAQVRRAIKAGALGYVTKREDPEMLVQCLRRVRQGERFLSPRAARAMADDLIHDEIPMPEQVLSAQELEVFSLAGRGYTAQTTADKMGLSVRTVETYYGRILEKLNLPGRRELRRQAADWVRTSSGN
ncbi:MAG TPA: response regulator transcription factor [bacterium]|nr:response regulator transcription factor [bacterium]